MVRPEFIYKLIYGEKISGLGSGGRKKETKKALKMTSYNWSFSALFSELFFFLISPEIVKTSNR